MFGVNAMKSLIVYEVLSRVVKDEKGVIGFMVKQKYKRSQPIFMSIEVLTFGLSNKNFEVVDVKLGGNGKPRGCNGFLLSKLPIETLLNVDDVQVKLFAVLKYIFNDMENDKNISFNKNVVGVTANYTATFKSSDYRNMEIDVAEVELNKTLKFYHKHLPKELKKYLDNIVGSVSEKGILNVTVSKSLVCEV